MEGHVDGRVIIQQDFDILETELQEARAQIAKLQRKQLGHNNKISLACFRISTLEITFKDIQAHELSLDHSKEMEGHVDGRVIIQQDFDILETELQEARAQIAKLQRKQLGHNNKISLACFRISTLEITFKDIQARHQMAPKRTSTSAAPAMNQPAIRQLYDNCVTAALKAQAANMANVDITNRNLKPREALVARTYSEKMIEAFIEGLPRSIEGNVIALKPETLEEAINIS
nr:reverse transcriptase domain-containing protein [Tanacetum cinerariifolium]